MYPRKPLSVDLKLQCLVDFGHSTVCMFCCWSSAGQLLVGRCSAADVQPLVWCCRWFAAGLLLGCCCACLFGWLASGSLSLASSLHDAFLRMLFILDLRSFVQRRDRRHRELLAGPGAPR